MSDEGFGEVAGGGENGSGAELSRIWMTLEPAMGQRRRIDARVFEWLEASDTSIVAEWLGLIKIQPFAAVGLVAVSAASIVFTIATASPLLWIARLLMSVASRA
jgi:hypothetical protein